MRDHSTPAAPMQGATAKTINIAKMGRKRGSSLLLAAAWRRLGDIDRAVAVEQCGTYLEVSTMQDHSERITAANFCRQRLCPLCTWRRSARIYAATSAIMDHIDRTDQDHKYLFLTLTVRNVRGEDLAATLDAMQEGWHRMQINRAYKRRVRGSMRTLEITRNAEDGTYHPHYHIILVVPANYARRSSGLYWTHEDWQRAWALAARLPYDPMVSIEAVKGGKRRGVEEMAHYLAKDAEYIIPDDPDATDSIVSTLHGALSGRRLVAYAGLMLQAQRALRIQDPEAGPLTDDVRGDVVVAIRRYHWHAGLGSYVPASDT